MQIHYIWIDSWRNLEQKDINLSAQYQFKFQKKAKNGHVANLLNIALNPDYIPNFFEKEKVSNVTGIIGKNGSGKSTILNFIKAFLPEGLEANLSSDIVVYSRTEGETQELLIAHPHRMEITLDAGNIPYRLIPYSDSLMEHLSIRTDAHLDHFDYIYYSYILDQKQEAADWAGLHNLSTTALIEESRRAIFSEINNQQKLDPRISDLEFLIKNELAKAIQFLLSPYKKLLPFNKPPELDLFIDTADEEPFKGGDTLDTEFKPSFNNARNFGEVQQLIHDLTTRTIDSPQETDLQLATDLFAKAVLANFYLMELKYMTGISTTHINNLGENETTTAFVIRFFQHLVHEKVSIYDQPDKHSYDKYIELSELAPRLILMFEELITREYIVVRKNNSRSLNAFVFNMKSGTDEVFEDFFSLYLKVKGFTPFLTFNWRGLSTGEQSFLSFMARFVHLKRHQIGSDQLKSNLLIMIDEGDAGFHPAWQKQFFKVSLDFLADLFKNHTIQLIYTANAPFLTSDLPKSHVVFLEKKTIDDTVFHTKDNDRLETFGANIHQLFMDSFYMDGVLIGDFAKYKIDKIINYLNNKRIKNPDDNYRRTIEQIGEPIIRRKLMLMWEEKFGTQNEIDTLMKRVKELREQERAKRKPVKTNPKKK